MSTFRIALRCLALVLLSFTVRAFAAPDADLVRLDGLKKAQTLTLAGNYLYAAGDKLAIYDVSKNPAKPVLVGELDISGGRQIAYGKGMVYLTARNKGVYIVDVRDVTTPKLVTRIDTLELATGIDMSGDVLFITLRIFGVQAFDVSDPAHPKSISHILTDEAQSCHYVNGLLAVGDWGSAKLTLIDAKNLRDMKLLSQSPLWGFGDGVFIKGNICYAPTGHHDRTPNTPKRKISNEERFGRGHGLDIFDISNPAKPVRLGGLKFARYFDGGYDNWQVKVPNQYAFIADTFNGAYVVDVTDPKKPQIVKHWTLPNCRYWSGSQKKMLSVADPVGDIVPGDGYVYVAGVLTGAYAVPFPAATRVKPEGAPAKFDPASPEPKQEIGTLKQVKTSAPVRRLAVAGDKLFAACSVGGVKSYAFTADGGLKELANLEIPCAYGVAAHGDKLFVAEGRSLSAWRIAADGKLTALGRLASLGENTQYQIVNLYCDGKIASLTGGDSRIFFVDVSDPAQMRVIFSDSYGALMYCDNTSDTDLDGLMPVNYQFRGPIWFNLKLKKNLCLKDHSKPLRSSQMNALGRIGESFILPIKGNKEYYLFKADGTDKTCKADAEVSGMPTVEGNKIVFSDRRNGVVRVFDAATPQQLKVFPNRQYVLKGAITDRAVWYKGRVFIPAFDWGILYEAPEVAK